MTTGLALRSHRTERFLPSEIANLYAWYEAGDLALADGTAVASWTDKTGNGRHAVQANGTKQPLLKTNIVSGRSVLRFDGTDDFLATAAFGVDLAQPNTILVVARHATQTGFQFVVDGIVSASKRHAIYHDSGASAFRIWANGGVALSQARDTNFNVRGGVFNGASSLSTKNGTTVSGSIGTNPINGLTIGAVDVGTSPLNGDVAELLLYTGALSTNDRQKLERWLGAKYGLSVA